MAELTIRSKITTLENNNKIIILNTNSDSIDITIQNIIFKGKNNILVIHPDLKFFNSTIRFYGSSSLCYLNLTNNHTIRLNLTIYNNSVYYQGCNNYFNGVLNCIVSESQNVLIGDNGIFSFDIWMRTSDAHLIYDLNTQKRCNYGKDLILGSRVWIGQGATLLKGATIGSGAIIGLGSIVSKKVTSNTLNAGNPLKEIKKNIVWDDESTQSFTEEDIKRTTTFKKKSSIESIFTQEDDNFLDWQILSKNLSQANIDDKLAILQELDIKPLVIQPIKKNKKWFRFFKN